MVENNNFSNLKIGDFYCHVEDITEDLVLSFSNVSGDKNPIHLSKSYARKTRFGKRIAHGMLIGSLISKILGNYFPGQGTIFLKSELKFKKPVYIGDTVNIKVRVIQKDESNKHINLQTIVTNQLGKVVVDGNSLVLLDNKKTFL